MVSGRGEERAFGIAQLALALLAVLLLVVQTGRAERFTDLWLTADQQGRLAWERGDFETAAGRFVDPRWRATAARRNGDYLAAAADYGRGRDPVDLYNRGVVLVRGRAQGEAITAFEAAVAAAPEWPEAAENLAITRAIDAYLLAAREAADTGEQTELGADDIVFDNDAERGREITITDESVLEAASAEKWMRGVDTRTRDFLRIRFLAEAVRREAE